MGIDISGTPNSLTIDGIAYRLAGDVNITEIFTAWENSLIPSSGRAMRKMMRRTPNREGVVLLTNAEERDNLKAQAESLTNLKLSYTNRAGDTYKCEGIIEIENNETEENRTTIRLLPVEDWTTFLAS